VERFASQRIVHAKVNNDKTDRNTQEKMMSDVVVIGAGAAGCFAAIELKRLCPEAKVLMLEKGRKALAKVAITGGGRCNLTNSFAEVRSLETVYPRGFRLMKKLLHHFSQEDTCRWF
jgi:predicted flavoprotein YhiN